MFNVHEVIYAGPVLESNRRKKCSDVKKKHKSVHITILAACTTEQHTGATTRTLNSCHVNTAFRTSTIFRRCAIYVCRKWVCVCATNVFSKWKIHFANAPYQRWNVHRTPNSLCAIRTNFKISRINGWRILLLLIKLQPNTRTTYNGYTYPSADVPYALRDNVEKYGNVM